MPAMDTRIIAAASLLCLVASPAHSIHRRTHRFIARHRYINQKLVGDPPEDPRRLSHGPEVALNSTTSSILILAQLTPQRKRKIIINQLCNCKMVPSPDPGRRPN